MGPPSPGEFSPLRSAQNRQEKSVLNSTDLLTLYLVLLSTSFSRQYLYQNQYLVVQLELLHKVGALFFAPPCKLYGGWRTLIFD